MSDDYHSNLCDLSYDPHMAPRIISFSSGTDIKTIWKFYFID